MFHLQNGESFIQASKLLERTEQKSLDNRIA